MTEYQGENRQPSKYTLILFASMDTKIIEIQKTLKNIEINIAGLPEKIFERGDGKYASKLTERIVFTMVGIVLTLVLTAVVYLVLK